MQCEKCLPLITVYIYYNLVMNDVQQAGLEENTYEGMKK